MMTTTIKALLAFCLTLPNAQYLEPLIQPNITAVAAVVDAEGPLPFPGTDLAARWNRTAELMLVMGFFEAGWSANPRGSNDEGRACGVMQVHTPDPAKCAERRASLSAGYRAGLRTLKKMLELCGTINGAVAAFASGSCTGAPKLVAYRMSFVHRRRRR
jgi:hypothetical protein